MGSLEWGDRHLEAKAPYIQLRAYATKAKRADTLPIRHDLVEALKAVRPESAQPTDRVFKTVPEVATLQRDLRKVGIDPLRNGVIIDLHALRHSYATMLASSEVPPRTAQVLMRHTDLKQTMSVYVHPRIVDSARAIEQLPDLLEKPKSGQEAEALRMTGTNGPAGQGPETRSRRSTSAPVRPRVLFSPSRRTGPLKDPWKTRLFHCPGQD